MKATPEEKHGITITAHACITQGTSTLSSIEDFRVKVAIPYLSALIENRALFFWKDCEATSSQFHFFSLFPPKEVNGYVDKEIELLFSFYGSEASVEYEGIEYTSPLLDADDMISGKYTTGQWSRRI